MKILFISVLVFLFVSVKVQLKCLLQHIICMSCENQKPKWRNVYFIFFGYMMTPHIFALVNQNTE